MAIHAASLLVYPTIGEVPNSPRRSQRSEHSKRSQTETLTSSNREAATGESSTATPFLDNGRATQVSSSSPDSSTKGDPTCLARPADASS